MRYRVPPLGNNIPFQNFCCVITLKLASLFQFLHQFHAPYITIYRKRKNVSLHSLLPLNCVTTAQCLHIRMKSVWRKVVGFSPPTSPLPKPHSHNACSLKQKQFIKCTIHSC